MGMTHIPRDYAMSLSTFSRALCTKRILFGILLMATLTASMKCETELLLHFKRCGIPSIKVSAKLYGIIDLTNFRGTKDDRIDIPALKKDEGVERHVGWAFDAEKIGMWTLISWQCKTCEEFTDFTRTEKKKNEEHIKR